MFWIPYVLFFGRGQKYVEISFLYDHVHKLKMAHTNVSHRDFKEKQLFTEDFHHICTIRLKKLFPLLFRENGKKKTCEIDSFMSFWPGLFIFFLWNIKFKTCKNKVSKKTSIFLTLSFTIECNHGLFSNWRCWFFFRFL